MADEKNNLMVCTVVQRIEDKAEFRILWLDERNDSFWIQLNNKANTPSAFHADWLREQLDNGSFVYIVDSYASIVRQEDVRASDAAKRDRVWNLISDAVSNEPDIYIPSSRSKILKEIESTHHIFAKNLYGYLGRYWKGGKVPNALLPDYSRCGKFRDPYKDGAGTPGRKRKEGAIGKKLSYEDLRIFQKALDKFYNNRNQPSLKEAYRMMIRHMYRHKDEQGNPLDCAANEIPSYRQFQYWHSANKDSIIEKKAREGEGNYDRNYRSITGKSETHLFGPGEKVQIDATIGDVYLVRRNDRSQIAGRPSIYFVRDAKTHIVTGMYISLDPPSWHSAGLALLNMGENKVEYCRKYGIEITQDQWPCQNLPCVLLADRGEVESHFADKLALELGITVENTPPYRGDLKGIIERFFRLVDVALGSETKGRVMADMGERGVQDYRLDAQLDIIQFTQIMIYCVLFYNNSHYLSGYIRSFLMRQKGVMPIPLKLWNFGIRYETGAMRTVSREKIRYSLLPQETAKITKNGISFHGLMYTSQEAEENNWFSLARIEGTETVTVSYDPRDAAFIYIRIAGKETPFECHLLEHHGMFVGMQSAEAEIIMEADKTEAKQYEIQELNARMKLDDQIDAIKSLAASMSPDTSGMTKAERIGSIRENRKKEKDAIVDENTTRSLSAAGLIPEQRVSNGSSGNSELLMSTPDPQKASRSALEELLDDVAEEIFQTGGD